MAQSGKGRGGESEISKFIFIISPPLHANTFFESFYSYKKICYTPNMNKTPEKDQSPVIPPKPIKRNRTIVTGFTVLPMHLDYLDHFIAEKAYLNRSDVVRRAIEDYHERAFPDYIYKRTATDIAKREKIASEAILESLSPIQFADREIGNGIHVTATDGEEYYLIHAFANFVHPIKLVNVKEAIEESADIIAHHKEKVKTTPVEKNWTGYMVQYFQTFYGITVDKIHNGTLKNYQEETKTEPNE